MGLGCGASIAKCLLIIFNICFFLFGAVILAVGIYILVDKQQLLELAKVNSEPNDQSASLLEIAAYVMIGLGAFNFIVGFCGCCGACTESLCLLRVYAICIIIVMIIEIVGVVLGAVYKNQLEQKAESYLKTSLNETYGGIPYDAIEVNAVGNAWNYAMQQFQCCGLNGIDDFKTNAATIASKWTKNKNYFVGGTNTTMTIPIACCQSTSNNILTTTTFNEPQTYLSNNQCPVSETGANQDGCKQAIIDYIKKYAIIIIAVAAVIALIEIVGVILACCLISALSSLV